MKKITYLLFALFSFWQISAQVSSYSFSQNTTGTYTPITGGTVQGVATNDDTSFNALPIGFSFTFNSIAYTDFSVNSNGFMAFGATVSSSYTGLSTGTSNNVIAAFNADLQGNTTTGELSYLLQGTAPNQTLTIQWKSYRHYGATGDDYNFQIVLHETTNVIDVVYGTVVQNSTGRTHQVGLRGEANTTYNNRTTATNWSATTSGTTNADFCTLTTAIIPASGLKFTWTPPACPGSVGITTANITSVSADVTWTVPTPAPANGYQYVITSTAGLPTGSGTASATNMVSAASLTANTKYYVYVMSDCGGGALGNWTLAGTFKTACVDVTSFSENFDTYLTGSANPMPDCWSKGGILTNTYIAGSSVAPMSPSNKLYMYASGTATAPVETYAIMPAVSNLQAGTHRLRFSAYATIVNHFIEVGYLTDLSDMSTFVSIQEVTLPGTVVASTQQLVVIPMAGAIPAGVKNLVIRNPGYPGSSTTAYIDDVAWEVIPACSNPTNVSATAVTANGATINWTGNATDVSWEIEYGAPGFAVGTAAGTIVPAGTNPFTLTMLTPATPYQYYVRAICSGSTTSANSFAGTFTTLCAAYVPDYSQNFATFPPSCWNRSGAGDVTTGPTGTATGSWFADGFLNSGTTGAVGINLYSTGQISWLISPTMNLTTGGYRVRYDVAATTWGGTETTAMGSDDTVKFVVSYDAGATWTALETFDTTNTPTNASVTKIYNIAAQTSATTLFAFLATSGTVDDTEDYDFFIDNFVVETPPATEPACATNVVATPHASCGNYPFSISWDATAGATGYKITVGTTAGGTDIANNVNLGLITTYTYNTPNHNTMYYYTVVPYNTIGDATGCTQQSFTTFATACACTPVYTYGTTSGDLISNVSITGTTLANNSGTATTGPSYTYYTGQPNYTATLQAGASYPVVVTVGTFGSQNVAVWIDYNDNLTFEASEKVGFTTASIAGNGSATFNITLSCSPPLGLHRMRVRDAYATTGSTIDPCSSYGWGETEDYDVTVTAAIACPQPSNLAATSITSTSASLTWNIGCAETMWDLHLTTAGGAAPTGTPSNPNVSSPFPATMLTASTTYDFYVRADCSANGTSLWTGPFTFTTTALPPANDNCTAPVTLTVNADLACGVVTSGTTVAATDSGLEPTFTVVGTPDNDVWFSFVATGTAHQISLTNVVAVVGTSTDMGMALFNGSGTCSALTLVGDSDPNTYNATGLTIGTTYYLSVYGYASGATSAQATFNVCVGTPPPPPSNDDCSAATVLTAGGVFATNELVGTNVSATGSTETAPGCASYLGGDVWYSVVVPASGSLTFEVNTNTGVAGALTDTAGAVYSGTCGALVLISCNDSSSANGDDQPLITVTGQTVGSTLYFRVWEYGNDSFGTFKVSAYDASLASASFDNASFSAYPNPVKDVLNLSYSSEISSVKVINLLGQEVISRKVNNTTSQIDMTGLTAGAYIVNVTVGDVVKTIKVIKQ